ncbi:MAG: ATP-grasp domain-containing protein [Pseudomonadota bacterium]
MQERLGIIGGGQLGGFLCQAAKQLGIHTTVLSPTSEGLVTEHASEMINGSFDDLAAVDKLLTTCDVITFELEDIPVETLQKLATQRSVRVFPEPSTMMLIQNKGKQKDWLVANGFPTSKHLRFDNGLDQQGCLEQLGPDFVIKTQRGGYDGQGVKVVRNAQVPSEYDQVPTIAEALIQDFCEIAALVARGVDGACVAFPLFQSDFDDEGNVVRRVVCPAPVRDEVAEQANALACEIVTAMGGTGIFAVEYFLTDSQLLVNEIAPRVHNVGHLTIEASNVSQFEQHVRAVMGMSLVGPQVKTAAMENLLYEEAIAAACLQSSDVKIPDVTVHWYGKKSPRTLRKMGHLTAVSDTLVGAGELADQALEALTAINAAAADQ